MRAMGEPTKEVLTLGHYRLGSRLGEGGMGVVYLAEDTQLERTVAIKLVSEKLVDSDTRQQLLAEARTASALNHPNICTIHEVGQSNGLTYIVMEHVAGEPLSALIPADGLPVETVLHYGIQIADAISHAHDRGVIHCDLKSANVVITPAGMPKVLDFGLARRVLASQMEVATKSTGRLTSSSTIAGTLHYLAPEALRGKGMDTRSDTWALGVLLYEMATGCLPFKGQTGFELSAAILREPPAPMPPRVSAGLRAVILHCLSKEPGQRYQRTSEVGAALQAIQSEKEVSPVRPPIRLSSRLSRIGWLFAPLGMLALLILLSWPRLRPSRAAPSAEFRRSVAVLGFKNVSGRPEAAWISPALSEMLTTELAAGEKLRTISAENVARAKTDLSLSDTDGLASDTIQRVRKNLGSDLIVLGSYVDLGKDAGGQLRLDLRVQDAARGQIVASLSETGSEVELFQLVSRTGGDLRQKLGLGEVSAMDVASAQAARPATPEVVRVYAEGLSRLRLLDFVGARDLLEKALASDPNYPLARSALAAAWSGMGYDDRAREEAKHALDLSTRLSREQRFVIEGRYWESAKEWSRAAESYRGLWNLFPDNQDYALSLAAAQTAGGSGKEALATIATLRKMPAPQRDDARIDYSEALAAMSTGDFKNALAAATRGMDLAKARGAKLLAANALLEEARACHNLGQPDKAKTALEEAQRIFTAEGNPIGTAHALTNLGNIAYVNGDLAGALPMYRESLALYLKTGNRKLAATTFSNIANVLTDQGENVQARNMYEQALANFREIHDKPGIAMGLNNIAGLLYQEGNLAEAKERFEQAGAVAHEIGDVSGEAGTQLNLGSVLSQQGKLDEAKQKRQDALAIYRQIGDQSSIATSLDNLGDTLRDQGDLVGATARHDEALGIAEKLGEKAAVAQNRLKLATLYSEQGRLPDAETAARQAAEEFQAENRRDENASAVIVLAQLHLQQGKLEDAKKEMEQVTSIMQQSSNKSLRLFAAIASARLRAASGYPQQALDSLQKTLATAKASGIVDGEFEVRLALGEIEMKLGRLASGRSRLRRLTQDAEAKGYLLIARKAAAAR
jgi:serine/threonine protein kinase/Tfp pilus assembly protein PilF